MSASPGGVSQSIMADFKFFVSSDLALEAPLLQLKSAKVTLQESFHVKRIEKKKKKKKGEELTIMAME